MFINMLWFPRVLFPECWHPLPSPWFSVGLPRAMIRKMKHRETDVMPMLQSHYPPFLTSQNISYLLSHRTLYSLRFFSSCSGTGLGWVGTSSHTFLVALNKLYVEWHPTDCLAFLCPSGLGCVEERRRLDRLGEREVASAFVEKQSPPWGGCTGVAVCVTCEWFPQSF